MKVRLVTVPSPLRVVDELSRQESIVTAGDSRTFILKQSRVNYLAKIGYGFKVIG